MFWRFHKECRIHNPLEVVSDGEDAVRYLEGNRLKFPLPVLLVLGLQMPHMGGLQVLRHLKDTCQRGFPTVLMIDSRDHDLPLVAAAFHFGVESFLIKPLQNEEFSDLMARLHAVKADACAVAAPASLPKPSGPNLTAPT
jgi:CheY-like chemotaxis protein